MSLPDRRSIQTAQQPLPFDKPLYRLQAYLVELKTSIGLFREVLLEIKDLLVVVTIIVFFALGVYEALKRLLE